MLSEESNESQRRSHRTNLRIQNKNLLKKKSKKEVHRKVLNMKMNFMKKEKEKKNIKRKLKKRLKFKMLPSQQKKINWPIRRLKLMKMKTITTTLIYLKA